MRMSTVLIIVGALALILGLALAGFGIPVSEFSFGNTLIMAGATTATGGLIVIALGAVVAQLQHLNEALASPPLPAHQHEPFAAAAAQRGGAAPVRAARTVGAAGIPDVGAGPDAAQSGRAGRGRR